MLNIPEFFRGKNIFITGGSGFLGKVLIEKLLRSCPELGYIYVLIRSKKGKDHIDRIKDIINSQLFEKLREKNPSVLSKLISVPGNITELGLGIKLEDKNHLLSKIDIIFNCAATVRFDLPLVDATIANVRSSRELCEFALQCKLLKVLVHVSTAYSNVHTSNIEERVYSPLMNWQDLINLVENHSQGNVTEILTEKFIGQYPNTYTFTKQIAEAVFVDMCYEKIPLILYRPSIIVSCLKEPIAGWIDNLNGPFAFCIPPSKGICSVVHIENLDSVLDFVFVDNVVKTLIISCWMKCCESEHQIQGDESLNQNTKEVTVYNACSEMLWQLKDFEKTFQNITWNIPLEDRLWLPPKKFSVSNWYQYYFLLVLKNIIPSLFLDALLKLNGKKPILINLLKKIYVATGCFRYFMRNSFTFKNDNYLSLEDKLMECDRSAFKYRTFIDSDNGKLDAAMAASLGVKRFVLKEKYPIEEDTFKNTYKLYYLDIVTKVFGYLLLIYVLFWKMDIVSYAI